MNVLGRGESKGESSGDASTECARNRGAVIAKWLTPALAIMEIAFGCPGGSLWCGWAGSGNDPACVRSVTELSMHGVGSRGSHVAAPGSVGRASPYASRECQR